MESPGTLHWLECSAGTSLARKAPALTADVIRIQHERYSTRFRFPGELVINMDARSVEQVARQIVAATSFGQASGTGTDTEN